MSFEEISFEEKSTWVMLLAVSLVYGWYFSRIAAALPAFPAGAGDLEYRGMMLGTVVALVIVSTLFHILLYAISPDQSDQVDERDRDIGRRGETIGGYVAAAAALTGMGMAMYEVGHFWIANAILLGLVLSELVSGLIKIYCYRRGF